MVLTAPEALCYECGEPLDVIIHDSILLCYHVSWTGEARSELVGGSEGRVS